MDRNLVKQLAHLFLPTILFFICYSLFGILPAIIITGSISVFIFLITFIKTKKPSNSQLVGILGMAISFIAIYFTGNDKYYFITPLISNCILAVFALVLTIQKKSIFHFVAKPFKIKQIENIPESEFISLNLMWLFALIIKTISKLLGVLYLDFKTIYWIAYLLSDPFTIVLIIFSIFLVNRKISLSKKIQNEKNTNDRNIIFYFSATGNSLTAARKLCSKIENAELYPMSNAPNINLNSGDISRIGFVFPVYYGMLPRLVNNFIENLKINPDIYCFAVVTSGGAEIICRGVLTSLNELLKKKGNSLSYGKVIRFTGNFVMKYDVPLTDNVQKQLKKAESELERVSENILNMRHNNVNWIKIALNKLYENIELIDKDFFSEDNCNGCAICTRVCPVQNIKLLDNRPVWQGHCEFCSACINFCPQSAIQYGSETIKRKRYHHPEIKLNDMINKNYSDIN